MVCIISEWDKTEFNIFVIKKPIYNIMVVSTFSGLTLPEGQTG